MQVFHGRDTFVLQPFGSESEFERVIVENSAAFFGPGTVYIDVKRKVNAMTLGRAIPDGFLFDLTDPENPEFYVVEVEIASHSFFGHIFPQVTMFFGFFKDLRGQSQLVDKLFRAITESPDTLAQFRAAIGDRELFKYLRDTIESSQNILLVIDGDKPELADIADTYAETWGRMVRRTVIRRFAYGEDTVYVMDPEFAEIDVPVIHSAEEIELSQREYSEEYLLDGVKETVAEAFRKLSTLILSERPDAKLNFTKYYAAIKDPVNTCYFEVRKSRLNVVLFLTPENVADYVTSHSIHPLGQSVQDWWTGGSSPCVKVVVTNPTQLEEIVRAYLFSLGASQDALLGEPLGSQ